MLFPYLVLGYSWLKKRFVQNMEGRKEAAAVTLKSTVVRGGETDVEVPVVNLSSFLLKGSSFSCLPALLTNSKAWL